MHTKQYFLHKRAWQCFGKMVTALRWFSFSNLKFDPLKPAAPPAKAGRKTDMMVMFIQKHKCGPV